MWGFTTVRSHTSVIYVVHPSTGSLNWPNTCGHITGVCSLNIDQGASSVFIHSTCSGRLIFFKTLIEVNNTHIVNMTITLQAWTRVDLNSLLKWKYYSPEFGSSPLNVKALSLSLSVWTKLIMEILKNYRIFGKFAFIFRKYYSHDIRKIQAIYIIFYNFIRDF